MTATTKSDLEIWREDDVRQAGLDRLLTAHGLTEAECGVAGGTADWLRRAADGEAEAKVALGRVTHILLNIMRAESGLEFTAEPDPNKWNLADLSTTIRTTGVRRKRVGGGTGDKFQEVPYIRSEVGWGNDVLVNRNPPNFDGEQNTNDARPGWWYRMIFLPENRDTVLSVQQFFKPEECEPARREHLLDLKKNPARAKALKVAEQTLALDDSIFNPPARRGRKAATEN